MEIGRRSLGDSAFPGGAWERGKSLRFQAVLLDDDVGAWGQAAQLANEFHLLCWGRLLALRQDHVLLFEASSESAKFALTFGTSGHDVSVVFYLNVVMERVKLIFECDVG